MEKNSRKGKQSNKYVKNIIGLKKLKVKIIKKRKKNKTQEKFTELQKLNIEAEVYNNNKKCDWIYTYTYTPIAKPKQSTKNKLQ